MRRGVAARDAVGLELKMREDALGEAGGLVCHHAPADVARAELAQQFGDAGKELRLAAAGFRVEIEELLAHRLVLGVVGLDAERDLQQTARAGRRERPQALERHRLVSLLDAHPVDGGGEVGRRIRQRAVEVEEDRAARHRASSRRGSSRRSRFPAGSGA